MPFMHWSDILTIDNGEVDLQHRQLVDGINAIHDAVVQSQEMETIIGTLDCLGECGARHFTHEENLIEVHAYPKLAQHRREHRHFIDRVTSFRAQLTVGNAGICHGMANFLGTWLVNHIIVADKAYSAFMRNNGSHDSLPIPQGAPIGG